VAVGFERRVRHWVLEALFVEIPAKWMSDPVDIVSVGSRSPRGVRQQVVLADRIVGYGHGRTTPRPSVPRPSHSCRCCVPRSTTSCSARGCGRKITDQSDTATDDVISRDRGVARAAVAARAVRRDQAIGAVELGVPDWV
jgi:hypothetical protein